jgi:hypothetical protein
MGVEELQLFVRLCNLTGLLPFRMILDEQTGRFKRFDGHWSHPVKWWCSFVMTIQIGVLVVNIYWLVDSLDPKVNFSLVYKLVFILYFLNYSILMLLSPRLFLFRLRQLETAFECLRRIDRMIISNSKSSNPTRRRTVIGILIILIDV